MKNFTIFIKSIILLVSKNSHFQNTDEDVHEMFRRQNSGKSLNGKQLRITKQSDQFSSLVFELANHPFMDKLMTKARRKTELIEI